jgi:hypothetical protein
MVGIAASRLAPKSAEVLISELGREQLELVRENCRLNECATKVAVRELGWARQGGDTDALAELGLTEASAPDLVLVSDCLYITVRDGLQRAFAETLRAVCTKGTVVYMATKLRIDDRERAVLALLEEEGFVLTEVNASELDYSDLVDASEDEESEEDGGGLFAMFAEKPEIHFVKMTLRSSAGNLCKNNSKASAQE